MSGMSSRLGKNQLIWLAPLLIIGAIFYFAPTIQIAVAVLFLSVFIIAFSAGALVQLKSIRRMSDLPKSTVRGASQGNVELSGFVSPPTSSVYNELQVLEKKGFWKFSIQKLTDKKGHWKHVVSHTSHQEYIPLQDKDAICWVDLSLVDYYTKKNTVEFSKSRLTRLIKKHPLLQSVKSDMADAIKIRFEEEWLPSDENVYAMGYFSSSPSSRVPDHLKEAKDITKWKKIAHLAEDTPKDQELKGTVTVDTLTMSRFGNSSTPVILSAFPESRIKRNLWFKFWLIIFCVLLLASAPILFFLDSNGIL